MLHLSDTDRFFDRFFDTKKIFVPMKAKFTPRHYRKTGRSVLYLDISGNTERVRINLGIHFDTKDWNAAKKRLNPTSQTNTDCNLVIDNYEAKITAVKTTYRLSERMLTPKLLQKELVMGMTRTKFVSFFTAALEQESKLMGAGTYRRHKSVLKKVREYQPEVAFLDITQDWFKNFRIHLKTLKNENTTIASNIASIKKFLRLAQRSGIRLMVNLDDIKVGSTKGNRTALQPAELKKCIGYYLSEEIPPSYRLILGYFLYSCMTGQRFSDVMRVERKHIIDGQIAFVSQKTQKDQIISLNQTATRIIAHEPRLFELKYANAHINDELKKIMRCIGINKKVGFHVARHTFATSYLRAGGTVENLRLLLGHSNITQTMVYVHLLGSEANRDVFRLDELLM